MLYDFKTTMKILQCEVETLKDLSKKQHDSKNKRTKPKLVEPIKQGKKIYFTAHDIAMIYAILLVRRFAACKSFDFDIAKAFKDTTERIDLLEIEHDFIVLKVDLYEFNQNLAKQRSKSG